VKLTDNEADAFLSHIVIQTLNHRSKTGEIRDDFLQLMLEARTGQLKQEEESALDSHEKEAQLKDDGSKKVKIDFHDDLVIAQCLLFILGGFDTGIIKNNTYSMTMTRPFSVNFHVTCCSTVSKRK